MPMRAEPSVVSDRLSIAKRFADMTLLSRAAFACTVAAIAGTTLPAAATELPAIRTDTRNAVPACATPGRLMAFLDARNGKLDARFERIADAYMRHGEDLGLRWDIAFFQMLLETGNLTFHGDVDIKQNNFAGLGATGGGNSGESFKDVSTGARAHLEHILMYSGAKVDNPVAERTRKVQEWGVLTGWQKTIKGPMTYQHLARQWAPRNKKYAHDIETVADSFYEGPCKQADPHPEWVAEARAGMPGATSGVVAVAAGPASKPAAGEETPGQAAARRSIEDARGDGRSALGATNLAKATQAPALSPQSEAAKAKPQPALTILNAPKPDSADAASDSAVAKDVAAREPAGKDTASGKDGAGKTADKGKPGKGGASVQTASAATSARQLAAPAVAGKSADAKGNTAADKPAGKPSGKCNVWTASYGGQKAIIIKAVTAESTNFTVLDVNEGTEKREAEAYIAAYAKDGEMVGEFDSSDKALDKAFELCPEG